MFVRQCPVNLMVPEVLKMMIFNPRLITSTWFLPTVWRNIFRPEMYSAYIALPCIGRDNLAVHKTCKPSNHQTHQCAVNKM